jgi:GTP cyclohydrolase II
MDLQMTDASLVAVDLLFERPVETRSGHWTELLFRFADSDIVVLAHGGWREAAAPLARVHSSCFAGHYLDSLECDCREQLGLAFERIAAEGVGLIVFLNQEGRGNGHVAAMRAAVYADRVNCTQAEAYRSLGYPADARSFAGAAAVLRHLGVRSLRLMTNNPGKVAPLVEAGIAAQPVPLVAPLAEHPGLARFYRDKAREGHLLSVEPAADER